MVLPYTIEGLHITGVTTDDDGSQVYTDSISIKAICPSCGQASSTVHGWYERHPQEIPHVGHHLSLCLTVKRYRCLNQECERQTFAERLSNWLYVFARRTNQLTELLYSVSMEVGAEVAHRVLNCLQIHVIGDTLLRVLRRKPLSSSTTVVRVIGVDDWAFKRGRSYGTIIVNLETHRVVDLLPNRTAETLAT